MYCVAALDVPTNCYNMVWNDVSEMLVCSLCAHYYAESRDLLEDYAEVCSVYESYIYQTFH